MTESNNNESVRTATAATRRMRHWCRELFCHAYRMPPTYSRSQSRDDWHRSPSPCPSVTQTFPPAVVLAQKMPPLHESPRPSQEYTVLRKLQSSKRGKHNALENKRERSKRESLALLSAAMNATWNQRKIVGQEIFILY